MRTVFAIEGKIHFSPGARLCRLDQPQPSAQSEAFVRLDALRLVLCTHPRSPAK